MSKHQIGYIFFSLFSLTYAFGMLYLDWSFIYYVPFLIIWFTILIYGSFTISANYHVEAVSNIETKERVVAITFDDGPSEFTPEILKLLAKYDAKASFFCIGKQVEKHPEILHAIFEQGHSIGNHSYTHSKVGFQSVAGNIREIQQADKAIEKVIGEKSRYFRPPFGVTNPNIMRALRKTKHQVIGWNVRSLDTLKHDEINIFNRIKRQLTPGSIILLHDTSEKSIKVLERLLIHLKKEDYKSLRIEDLLKLKS